ncbi:MAG: TPM domain-containing protein, partial [Christensenellales bacterium]
TVFTDAGIQYIGEELKAKMKSADYAGTFFGFADLCDRFTDQAKKDRPYDTSNLPIKPLSFKYIPISLGIGLVIALIAVSVMKSKLKTVRYKAEANSYVRPGSMNITVSRDLFIRRTVAVSQKSKNNGGSDGGSSTHTSSSGSTHGGGGGSF